MPAVSWEVPSACPRDQQFPNELSQMGQWLIERHKVLLRFSLGERAEALATVRREGMDRLGLVIAATFKEAPLGPDNYRRPRHTLGSRWYHGPSVLAHAVSRLPPPVPEVPLREQSWALRSNRSMSGKRACSHPVDQQQDYGFMPEMGGNVVVCGGCGQKSIRPARQPSPIEAAMAAGDLR